MMSEIYLTQRLDQYHQNDTIIYREPLRHIVEWSVGVANTFEIARAVFYGHRIRK